MIQVFCGEDRMAALKEVERVLGKNYETIEGSGLSAKDLPELFRGFSLFDDGEARRILVKDLLKGVSVEDVVNYLDTPHEVILLEQKVDGRSAAAKKLKIKKFEIKFDSLLAFKTYDMIFRDREKAMKMLEQLLERGDAPQMIVGAWGSCAIKKMENARPGSLEMKKASRALKELSKLDIELKSNPTLSSRPELLLSSSLLRLSSL